MAIHVQRLTASRAVPRRSQPLWLNFLLSLVWVLRGVLVLLVAIVTGLLIPPSNPDKYRPLAPKARGKQ